MYTLTQVKVFDTVLDNEKIISRAKSVTKAYDEFLDVVGEYAEK